MTSQTHIFALYFAKSYNFVRGAAREKINAAQTATVPTGDDPLGTGGRQALIHPQVIRKKSAKTMRWGERDNRVHLWTSNNAFEQFYARRGRHFTPLDKGQIPDNVKTECSPFSSRSLSPLLLSWRFCMQAPHTCPECKGSGCAPQPLHAPDDSLFLFPRCECCKGKGRLSEEQHETYIRRKQP